jgi:hypothetical protein
MNQSYPSGVDGVWLAADRSGHVAAFVTAGAGPIPIHWLNTNLLSIDSTECELDGLPFVSEADLLEEYDRPGDFIDLAKRGIFAYDWSDVHSTMRVELRAYQLIAAPTKPVSIESLPAKFIDVLTRTRLQRVDFAGCRLLDVREYYDCLLSPDDE